MCRGLAHSPKLALLIWTLVRHAPAGYNKIKPSLEMSFSMIQLEANGVTTDTWHHF